MMQVNIQAAKTQLSRLVEEARAGKEIVLAKAGKPMVRLVPITSEGGVRKSGQWAGRAKISPSFDDEDPRIVAMFSGKPVPPSK
ncbi:MAG: type II toxin-antitoxin system prevent-host-death family antitoxin [Polyangiaceae bacterium]|nr:type II toxin-antitoxin system prevent-host-death family antitoxin [Polyangiaceae bacterium]